MQIFPQSLLIHMKFIFTDEMQLFKSLPENIQRIRIFILYRQTFQTEMDYLCSIN